MENLYSRWPVICFNKDGHTFPHIEDGHAILFIMKLTLFGLRFKENNETGLTKFNQLNQDLNNKKIDLNDCLVIYVMYENNLGNGPIDYEIIYNITQKKWYI